SGRQSIEPPFPVGATTVLRCLGQSLVGVGRSALRPARGCLSDTPRRVVLPVVSSGRLHVLFLSPPRVQPVQPRYRLGVKSCGLVRCCCCPCPGPSTLI